MEINIPLITETIAAQALATPSRPALADRNAALTYAEFDAAINGMVQLLEEKGVGKGDRVAVYGPKTTGIVVALFAALRLGAVIVPIHPNLKAAQVTHILEDSEPVLFVTVKARLEAVKDIKPHIPRLLVDQWPQSHERKQDAAQINELAALFYTSGSTGRAKGVMVPHRTLALAAHSMVRYLKLNTDDHILSVLPLGFDYGFSQLTSAFAAGASVTLYDYLFPQDVVKAIQQSKATVLAAVPTLWAELSDQNWQGVDSLRTAMSSGGRMPQRIIKTLQKALPGLQFHVMYGLTEAFRSTSLPPEDIERKAGSVGLPIPFAEVHILREDGTLADIDETGELVHTGPLVTLGYWRDRERTEKRFRPAPVLEESVAVFSGDRARRDRDGYFYFEGRMDQMIKTSGYRVSPEEVEDILRTAPGVRDAAVTGIPDTRLGESIVAFITGDVEEDAVIEHCRGVAPSYMVPSRIKIVADIPKTKNGKPDRDRIRREWHS